MARGGPSRALTRLRSSYPWRGDSCSKPRTASSSTPDRLLIEAPPSRRVVAVMYRVDTSEHATGMVSNRQTGCCAKLAGPGMAAAYPDRHVAVAGLPQPRRPRDGRLHPRPAGDPHRARGRATLTRRGVRRADLSRAGRSLPRRAGPRDLSRLRTRVLGT